MDGVSGLDVLTFVLRVAPAVVPPAAALLALIVWLRLTVIGRVLRARGEERLALYADFIVVTVGFVGAFFVLEWVAAQLGGDPFARILFQLRLSTYVSAWEVAGVSALLLLAYFAVAAASERISEFLGETESAYAVALRPATAAERFVWVSAMAPTAGFCEEVIFRGMLLLVLFQLGADAVIAVALSSLAFALGHAVYGLTWTVGTMVLGVVSAAAVLWCGSLWPAIIAHTLYDMTVYYVFEGAPAEGRTDVPAPEPLRFMRALPPLR